MGASAAASPTSPEDQPRPGLRASDAERDEVAARLRDEFIAGRLSHDTFLHRMDAVLQARQRADLPPLVADLPAQRGPSPIPPARHPAARYRVRPGPAPRPLLAWVRAAFARLAGLGGQAGGQGGAQAGRQAGLPGAARAVRGTVSMGAASSSRSPLSLRFPRGAGAGGGGEFSIGRDAGCDLAIADMTVSRRHATLERTPDGWLISDLESTNGTRVNGWRVRGKVTVRPGDLISFGTLQAIFAREEAAPSADTPAPGVS